MNVKSKNNRSILLAKNSVASMWDITDIGLADGNW